MLVLVASIRARVAHYGMKVWFAFNKVLNARAPASPRPGPLQAGRPGGACSGGPPRAILCSWGRVGGQGVPRCVDDRPFRTVATLSYVRASRPLSALSPLSAACGWEKQGVRGWYVGGRRRESIDMPLQSVSTNSSSNTSLYTLAWAAAALRKTDTSLF